jgi:hypothetical protein
MWMRPRWPLAALAASLFMAPILAGCTPGTSAPPPPKPGAVTPATADQIVRTYAVREWNAMRTWSTAQQSRLELPPQVTIDNATWDYNKAAHVPTLKPPADLARIPITVMVPENATVFEALTNGVYMVFVKHGGTWMQQYSPGKAPGAPALTPKLNARGFAELVSGSDHGRLKWSVSTIAARYAADLAGAARGTPAPDPRFVAGPYTRGLWNSLSAQGYTEATAAAAAYPTYAFSLQGGRRARVLCRPPRDYGHRPGRVRHHGGAQQRVLRFHCSRFIPDCDQHGTARCGRRHSPRPQQLRREGGGVGRRGHRDYGHGSERPRLTVTLCVRLLVFPRAPAWRRAGGFRVALAASAHHDFIAPGEERDTWIRRR